MSRFRPAADGSPADWVVRAVGPFGTGVGSLVPHGFEACARILHPAATRGGEPVRWDAIAAWSGGIAHRMAEFEPLARHRPAGRPGAAPFDQPPRDGHLVAPVLSALADVLAEHTGTAEACWFGLWSGYGWTSGEPMVHLPERDYLLFEGQLAAVNEMGWWLDGRLHLPQSPNLMWPADHAWFVASEIDLDSTHVGGSAALIEALVKDPRLEAWPALLTDPVWATSDEINR